jgi:serine/threonine protein kinase
MALAPGTRLGAYEIVGAIGAGGMGEVYCARDIRLKRDVALKILREAVANDPERLARSHANRRCSPRRRAQSAARTLMVRAA